MLKQFFQENDLWTRRRLFPNAVKEAFGADVEGEYIILPVICSYCKRSGEHDDWTCKGCGASLHYRDTPQALAVVTGITEEQWDNAMWEAGCRIRSPHG